VRDFTIFFINKLRELINIIHQDHLALIITSQTYTAVLHLPFCEEFFCSDLDFEVQSKAAAMLTGLTVGSRGFPGLRQGNHVSSESIPRPLPRT